MPRENDPKLLVIDDDTPVRQSIAAFFEDYYFHVAEAENGKIGLEVFSVFQPDIILLDLHMPVMDGQEVLKALKEKTPKTPVIVVSGNGLINETVTAMNNGAWGYVMKPIDDLSLLEKKVQDALEKARTLRNENPQQIPEDDNIKLIDSFEDQIKKLQSRVQYLEYELEKARLENEALKSRSTQETDTD